MVLEKVLAVVKINHRKAFFWDLFSVVAWWGPHP
jgi:hypothetical protein